MEELMKQFLESLQVGVTGLSRIRQVNSKDPEIKNYELEIDEKMNETNAGSYNVYGILNYGDPRFNNGGARRAWAPVKAWQAVKFFGVTQEQLDSISIGQEGLWLGITQPIISHNGEDLYLRVKITETFEGDAWDLANIDKTAKRKGKAGDHIYGMNNGTLSHIFSKTYVDVAKGAMVKNPDYDVDLDPRKEILVLTNQFEHTFIDEATVEATPQGVSFDKTTGEVVDKLPTL